MLQQLAKASRVLLPHIALVWLVVELDNIIDIATLRLPLTGLFFLLMFFAVSVKERADA